MFAILIPEMFFAFATKKVTTYLREDGESLSGHFLAHSKLGQDVLELLVVDDVVACEREGDGGTLFTSLIGNVIGNYISS